MTELGQATYEREDTVPYWIPDHRPKPLHEHMPLYHTGIYGVYEIDGTYVVTTLGTLDPEPFKTTDLELAQQVCDRWADEL